MLQCSLCEITAIACELMPGMFCFTSCEIHFFGHLAKTKQQQHRNVIHLETVAMASKASCYLHHWRIHCHVILVLTITVHLEFQHLTPLLKGNVVGFGWIDDNLGVERVTCSHCSHFWTSFSFALQQLSNIKPSHICVTVVPFIGMLLLTLVPQNGSRMVSWTSLS